MRTSSLCLFCLLMYSGITAQNPWPLFPLQQRSFWKAGNHLELYYCDQETASGDLLFGSEYLYGNADQSCFDTLVSAYFDSSSVYDNGPQRPTPKIDTLRSLATGAFAFNFNQNLVFYTDAMPGFSWTTPAPAGSDFDSIVWERGENFPLDLLDFTTQAATYLGVRYQFGVATDALQFTLTEDFGLVEFVPFRQWFDNSPITWRIAGLEKNDLKLGFTQRFEDFFHTIQPGSVFKYRVDSIGFSFTNRYQTLQRDSVTSVSISAAGVTVGYQRRFKQTKLIFMPPDDFVPGPITYGNYSFSREFLLETYAYDLLQTPDWFFYGADHNGVSDFSYFLADTLRLDEHGRARQKLLIQEVLDWDNCEWFATEFCDNRYGLGEGIGIAWEGWLCFIVGWQRELIGYKIGEDTLGDIALIQIINDVQEPSAALPLQISPNPGRNFIDVTRPSAFIHSNDLELSLFDAQGKLVKTSSENPNGSVLRVDAAFLPVGLYTLRLRCRDGVAVGKWVKG